MMRTVYRVYTCYTVCFVLYGGLYENTNSHTEVIYIRIYPFIIILWNAHIQCAWRRKNRYFVKSFYVACSRNYTLQKCWQR